MQTNEKLVNLHFNTEASNTGAVQALSPLGLGHSGLNAKLGLFKCTSGLNIFFMHSEVIRAVSVTIESSA
jgi:hypothetical protein